MKAPSEGPGVTSGREERGRRVTQHSDWNIRDGGWSETPGKSVREGKKRQSAGPLDWNIQGKVLCPSRSGTSGAGAGDKQQGGPWDRSSRNGRRAPGSSEAEMGDVPRRRKGNA